MQGKRVKEGTSPYVVEGPSTVLMSEGALSGLRSRMVIRCEGLQGLRWRRRVFGESRGGAECSGWYAATSGGLFEAATWPPRSCFTNFFYGLFEAAHIERFARSRMVFRCPGLQGLRWWRRVFGESRGGAECLGRYQATSGGVFEAAAWSPRSCVTNFFYGFQKQH